MKAHIVLGLGFGDEGKGITTSSLVASLDKPIVVRFNGGHQAGHTVIYDDEKSHQTIRHVFSNFGSGTLQDAPTIWSKFCTFDPVGVYNEYKALMEHGIKPKLYVDMDCPLVTAYDKHANVVDPVNVANGTCGVGFGKTLQRHEDFYKIHVRDMFYPWILERKLIEVHRYYGIADGGLMLETLAACKMILAENMFEPFDSWANFWWDAKATYQNVIFEGAQGIMLDQDYGFFPHVTRSNTTGRNAQILYETMPFFMEVEDVTTYYVTRAYQTRHGNGPIGGGSIELKNNENETNVKGIQGEFRTAPLNIDQLRYALSCNKQFEYVNNKLVITCLDQIDNPIPVVLDGQLARITLPEVIGSLLGFPMKDNPNNLIAFNSPITKRLW